MEEDPVVAPVLRRVSKKRSLFSSKRHKQKRRSQSSDVPSGSRSAQQRQQQRDGAEVSSELSTASGSRSTSVSFDSSVTSQESSSNTSASSLHRRSFSAPANEHPMSAPKLGGGTFTIQLGDQLKTSLLYDATLLLQEVLEKVCVARSLDRLLCQLSTVEGTVIPYGPTTTLGDIKLRVVRLLPTHPTPTNGVTKLDLKSLGNSAPSSPRERLGLGALSPRELFTIHMGEVAKRTIVFDKDIVLLDILEKICEARSLELADNVVTTMEGAKIKFRGGVTLGDLATRHVRFGPEFESSEERREMMRKKLGGVGFLDFTEGAGAKTVAVKREILAFAPMPVAEEVEIDTFTVEMNANRKVLLYVPTTNLLKLLSSICHKRSWSLADRIVLNSKGRVIESLDIPLSDLPDGARSVQFLSRDEVKAVRPKNQRYKGSHKRHFVALDLDAANSDVEALGLPAATPRQSRHSIVFDPHHISGTPLPSVVTIPHSSFITVELQLSLESMTAESLQMVEIEDSYTSRFLPRFHYNWCTDESLPPVPSPTAAVSTSTGHAKADGGGAFIVSVLPERRREGYLALKNAKEGFTSFYIHHDSLGSGTRSLGAKLTTALEDRFDTHLVRIKDTTAPAAIAAIETALPQQFDTVKISVVLCVGEQTNPMEWFANATVTPSFEKFMRDTFQLRGELHGTHHFSWRNRSVLLYLSVNMNQEEIRRIIGNVTCVLLFHDTDPTAPPFDPTETHVMGAMPQAFAVVRPAGDRYRYRVGVFNRSQLKRYGPQVPVNYLFESAELKQFLLVKYYNAMMMTMVSPPICRLYMTPRLHRILSVIDDLTTKAKASNTSSGINLKSLSNSISHLSESLAKSTSSAPKSRRSDRELGRDHSHATSEGSEDVLGLPSPTLPPSARASTRSPHTRRSRHNSKRKRRNSIEMRSATPAPALTIVPASPLASPTSASVAAAACPAQVADLALHRSLLDQLRAAPTELFARLLALPPTLQHQLLPAFVRLVDLELSLSDYFTKFAEKAVADAPQDAPLFPLDQLPSKLLSSLFQLLAPSYVSIVAPFLTRLLLESQSFDIGPLVPDDSSEKAQHLANLLVAATELTKLIANSVASLPPLMLHLLQTIAGAVRRKHPKNAKEAASRIQQMLVDFLFQRLWVPAIATPLQFLQLPVPVTPLFQRNMLTLSKLLLAVAKAKPFSAASHMALANSWVADETVAGQLSAFLTAVVEPSEPLSDGPWSLSDFNLPTLTVGDLRLLSTTLCPTHAPSSVSSTGLSLSHSTPPPPSSASNPTPKPKTALKMTQSQTPTLSKSDRPKKRHTRGHTHRRSGSTERPTTTQRLAFRRGSEDVVTSSPSPLQSPSSRNATSTVTTPSASPVLGRKQFGSARQSPPGRSASSSGVPIAMAPRESAPVYCTNCGKPSKGGDNYCAHCGTSRTRANSTGSQRPLSVGVTLKSPTHAPPSTEEDVPEFRKVQLKAVKR